MFKVFQNLHQSITNLRKLWREFCSHFKRKNLR